MFRPEIEQLEQNGITAIALKRISDPKVIPLWFGEGDLVTAPFIRDAAKQALDDGNTFYTYTRGRLELRAAIKRYHDRLYSTDLNPDRITVPGSTMLGITLAAQMCLGRGDHGLIVSPAWPNIKSTFEVTGAESSYVRQRLENNRWSLDIADIEKAMQPNTRAVFVNSPCNPTGWIMTREQQQQLLTLCRERDAVIIADEVYHRNVYDAPVAPSFSSFAGDDEPVIVVNGFSKAFAMTGWRLGWMLVPSRFATHMAVLSECFNTGAPNFIQLAGIAALDDGDDLVADLGARYARGRDLVMDILAPHPRIELPRPDGAFYAFPKVEGLNDSFAFCEALLEVEDVGTAPGYTFGPGNEAHFRLCFAQSAERLEEALRRILRFLDRNEAY